MSSGSNNQPNSKNHELGLALPPKSKVIMPLVAPKPPTVSQQQHQLLYPSNMRPTTAANNNNNNPFVPAQNPLLPASFAATTTAALGGNHPHHQNPLVATFNPVMLHMNAANGMMAAAASNNSGVTHHHSTLSSSSSNAPGSSNFFQGWKLRSGKWLEEEEAYAELLINMFDRGLLSDCMTGSTLRAYLAQKLHCAPMRISKKFAGKGIGKKVYSCRMENCTSNRKTIPATVVEQKRKLQEKAQEVEKSFHEAASCDAVSLFGEQEQLAKIHGKSCHCLTTQVLLIVSARNTASESLGTQLCTNDYYTHRNAVCDADHGSSTALLSTDGAKWFYEYASCGKLLCDATTLSATAAAGFTIICPLGLSRYCRIINNNDSSKGCLQQHGSTAGVLHESIIESAKQWNNEFWSARRKHN